MMAPSSGARPSIRAHVTLSAMARSRIAKGPASAVVRPLGSLWRLRARVTLDLVITLAVTLLALGLAAGYQLVGRWSRRSGA